MYTHTRSGQQLQPPATGSTASREDRKGRQGPQAPAPGRAHRAPRAAGGGMAVCGCPGPLCYSCPRATLGVVLCWCTQTQVPRKQPRTISERRQPHRAAGPSEINEEEENPSAFLPLLFWSHFPTKCNLQKHQNYAELKQSKKLEFFSSKGTFQSIEVSTRSTRLLPVRTHRPLVGKKGIVCGQENQQDATGPTEMLRETYL